MDCFSKLLTGFCIFLEIFFLSSVRNNSLLKYFFGIKMTLRVAFISPLYQLFVNIREPQISLSKKELIKLKIIFRNHTANATLLILSLRLNILN